MHYLNHPLPSKPYKIGYASGFFDLFHIGHLRYLQRAAKHCETLIVGVPHDDVVRADNRPRPFIPCAQRMAIVSELRCVSEVRCVTVSMEQPLAFAEFMRSLEVAAVFVGEDWRDSPRWQRLGPILHERGLGIHFLPRTEGISSTWIKQRLAGGGEAGVCATHI